MIFVSVIVFTLNLNASSIFDPPKEDIDFAVNKLREYCVGCHGLGDLRFIYSEDNQEVWDYIFQNKSSHADNLWSDEIKNVLNWPTDEAPSFDKLMDPKKNRDWMPKGSKRIGLAHDKIDEVFTRCKIIEILKSRKDKAQDW